MMIFMSTLLRVVTPRNGYKIIKKSSLIIYHGYSSRHFELVSKNVHVQRDLPPSTSHLGIMKETCCTHAS